MVKSNVTVICDKCGYKTESEVLNEKLFKEFLQQENDWNFGLNTHCPKCKKEVFDPIYEIGDIVMNLSSGKTYEITKYKGLDNDLPISYTIKNCTTGRKRRVSEHNLQLNFI